MKVETLKRRAEFQRLRGGGRYSAAGFLIEWKPRSGVKADETAGPRFGFTITRKIGNAVVRNRIRRRIKGALQELLPAHACGPVDFVIVARKPALDLDFVRLKSDLAAALQRASKPAPRVPAASGPDK